MTACLLVGLGYVAFAVPRSPTRLVGSTHAIRVGSQHGRGAPSPAASVDPSASIGTPPQVVFQNVAPDEAYGQVAVVPLDQA